MKAFEVHYTTPRSGGKVTVLAEDRSQVDENLSEKVPDFKKFRYRGGSDITFAREVSMSSVSVSELSVAELLSLLK